MIPPLETTIVLLLIFCWVNCGYSTNLINVSDIRSITMGTLLDLKKDLNKAVKRYSDKVLKSHLSYCIAMIDDAMMSS